jgi:hypothetical protein
MPTSLRPSRLPWILVAVVVAVAVWAVESSGPFQECVAAGKPTHGSILSVRRECLGEFVDENGEAITATFTVVLAVSTILLWFSTRDAAYAARAAADHIPRVERGYIIGGGPWRRRDEEGVIIPDIGWVSVGNYGKTPAVLKKVEWGFCNENIFPKDQPVSQLLNEKLLPAELIQSIQKEDVIRSGEPPRSLDRTEFVLSENVGKIFFGRFTYAIFFDDVEHFSTFKLKLGPDGESTGLPGSYSDWN